MKKVLWQEEGRNVMSGRPRGRVHFMYDKDADQWRIGKATPKTLCGRQAPSGFFHEVAVGEEEIRDLCEPFEPPLLCANCLKVEKQ